jgi:hypothetical protein
METMLFLTKLNLNETQRREAEDDLRVGDGTPRARGALVLVGVEVKEARAATRVCAASKESDQMRYRLLLKE